MPGVIILVIEGSKGSPNRHLEVQVSIFSDFRFTWGAPWEWLGAPFCDFSVIWGAKLGDRFQVHVLGDPGMEMMSESGGCMCYKHNKIMVLVIFHSFHLFKNLVSPGRVLGVILVTFGDLGHTFSDIWGYWEQAWILMAFLGIPWRTLDPATPPSWG